MIKYVHFKCRNKFVHRFYYDFNDTRNVFITSTYYGFIEPIARTSIDVFMLTR